MNKHQARSERLNGCSANLKRRRGIAICSMIGMAVLGAGALRQLGVVKHLPDPPGAKWDADKVTTSDEAYPFGIPDAPLALTTLAANVVIASTGGEDRARSLPLVPILAFGKTLMDSTVGLWYLYKMLTKEKVLCAYCLMSNATLLIIAALALPEAAESVRSIERRKGKRKAQRARRWNST